MLDSCDISLHMDRSEVVVESRHSSQLGHPSFQPSHGKIFKRQRRTVGNRYRLIEFHKAGVHTGSSRRVETLNDGQGSFSGGQSWMR